MPLQSNTAVEEICAVQTSIWIPGEKKMTNKIRESRACECFCLRVGLGACVRGLGSLIVPPL